MVRGVSGNQFFGLQAAFPSCCVVKRTHQAASLTAANGRKRKKIFFRGTPLGAWVGLLPQIKCLLSCILWGANHLELWFVFIGLQGLCLCSFPQRCHATSTSGELREPLPLTPRALVETGGNGGRHHFPCLWERLPHLGWEGGPVRGEKWPKILAPSFLVFFHPHRLLAVGCSLGDSG